MSLDKEIRVVFADKKLKEAYLKLKESKTAFDDLKKNPFCGIQIPKKTFLKFTLKNTELIIYGNMIYQRHGDCCIP